jgi:hypothetical protein
LVASLALAVAACGGGGDDGGGADRSEGRERGDVPSLFLSEVPTVGRAVTANVNTDDGLFPTFDDDGGFGGYTGETYELGVYPTDGTTSVGYGVDDFGPQSRVVATFDAAATPTDAGFGVTCRMQGQEESYYQFGIGNDGTYAISRVDAGVATVLTGEGSWVVSDLIDTDPPQYEVQAVCAESELTLLVDGEEIGSASDSTYAGGQVGVFLRTFTEGDAGVDVTSFEAIGLTDPDAVSEDTLASFESFVASSPLEACELQTAEGLALEPEPAFVATCDTALYAYMRGSADAEDLFHALLDETGIEPAESDGFPDCVRERNRIGRLRVRDGEEPGAVTCLDVGRNGTLVMWYRPEASVVGAFRVEDTGARWFRDAWAVGWWPFAAEIKPGS